MLKYTTARSIWDKHNYAEATANKYANKLDVVNR